MDLTIYEFIIKSNNNNDFFLIQFDGGVRYKYLKYASGSCIFNKDKKMLFRYGQYLDDVTHNQAEYFGLIGGLKRAREFHIKNILIEGDSLLVINQILNKWKVKNDNLKILYNTVIELFKNFDSIGIRHISRNDNKEADKIVNEVMELEDNIYDLL